MLYNRLGYVLLIIFICSLHSCEHNSKKETISDSRLDFINKTVRKNNTLLNKKIDLNQVADLDTIFDNGSSKIVVMVLMLSDCSGCRKTVYEIANRLDKLSNAPLSLVVGTNIKVSRERLNNGLLQLPYVEDPNLKLKSSLNLTHTPSALFISNGVIKNVLSIYPYNHVSGYDDEKEITDFISSVIFD